MDKPSPEPVCQGGKSLIDLPETRENDLHRYFYMLEAGSWLKASAFRVWNEKGRLVRFEEVPQ